MSSLAEIDASVIAAQAQSALNGLLVDREDIMSFMKFLAGFGRVVVFGGFVRDAIHNYLHTDKQQYRDLDLVVVGHLQRHANTDRNNFGGYRRFFADGLKIDYWTLDSTYAFSKGLIEPSLHNLALTTVFTINACVLDPEAATLYEHDAIHAIAQRRISFNCKGYLKVFPEYQAFRAIDFSERLHYALDEDVKGFVAAVLCHAPLGAFVRAVRAHRPDLSDSHLTEIYERYRTVRIG